MPIRVVIAEDERLVALALRSLVESQGFKVVGIAGTGREAVDLCRSQSPDLVLMDVHMPEMDGIEATRALMQEQPTCVVVVSGNGQGARIAEAEAVGAMDYVVKPFMASRVNPVVETAQQRFRRFMSIREGATTCQEALQTWQAVRSAVKALAEKTGSGEDSAYEQLVRTAAERGISLRAAAQQTLANHSPN